MERYPEFVKKIKCCPENEEYRYVLDVCFECINNVKKTAMIIMQNPSRAGKNESDKTVNKVLNYLYHFGYDRVIITNVIPFYGTDIADILEMDLDYKNSEILNQNISIITKIGKRADKIFAAWGWIYPKRKISKKSRKELTNCYNEGIRIIKDLFCNTIGKNLYCYCMNKGNQQPKHPLYWANGKKEEDFKIFL